ncbi:MAG: hypothetical protein RI901_1138 [Actinomycetota bacterium]
MSLIYESTPDVELIDARGPRFSALLTTIVLGTALAQLSLQSVHLKDHSTPHMHKSLKSW